MNTKRFKNDPPIQVQWDQDFDSLNLSAFPLVEDFVIVPVLGEIPGWRMRQPHLVGAQFHSDSIGYLAGYQWWEHIFYINKLQRGFSTQDVPGGTVKDPHSDFQPGWQIIIFEHERYTYILQADDDQTNEFSTWFRVSSQDYSKAWLAAMDKVDASRR